MLSASHFLQHVPLNVGAIMASPKLKPWLQSWLGPELEVLTPIEWYMRGHDHAGYKDILGGMKSPILKPGI